MATRFRTRKMKRRHALKTRKQRGGVTLFGKTISLPLGKKSTPLKSMGVSNTPSNTFVSGKNPLAQNLNARKANLMMNKINAFLQTYKKESGRTPSLVSDPGSVTSI